MTMQTIKGLTDWARTLAAKSVHVKLPGDVGGRTLRIVGAGRKYLRVMDNGGCTFNVEPEQVESIVGL